MQSYLYRITAKIVDDIAADSAEEALDIFADEHGIPDDVEIEVIEERED